MTSARPAYGRVCPAHTPVRGATAPGLHLPARTTPRVRGFAGHRPRSSPVRVAPDMGTGHSATFCGINAVTGHDSIGGATRKRLTWENSNGQKFVAPGGRGQLPYLRVSETECAS